MIVTMNKQKEKNGEAFKGGCSPLSPLKYCFGKKIFIDSKIIKSPTGVGYKIKK
jgi:hypothetical protein